MSEKGFLATIDAGLKRFYKLYTAARAARLDNLDMKISEAVTPAFLTTLQTLWSAPIVNNKFGRWVGLRGQTVNINSDPAYTALINNAPLAAWSGGEDIVPKMTANNAPAGYVASLPGAGAQAFTAFDKNHDTYAASAAGTYTNGVGDFWIQIELPSATRVTSYSLVQYPRGATYAKDQTFRDWTFEGSNDGTTFVVLDAHIDDPGTTVVEVKNYILSEVAVYKFYRLRVTRIHFTQNASPPTNQFVIRELCLLGGDNYTLIDTFNESDKTYLYAQTLDV
jgi:hypothetical protein